MGEPPLLHHIRLRGYTAEEVTAQTMEQIMTPESLQIVARVLEEELTLEASGTADPGRTRILELEEYRKDGSVVWLENHMAALRDNEKKLIGIIALSRDITERKRAEAEKEKLQAELMQAQRMESVGRLAGGVAHDFNNKLTVILGYGQMAMEGLAETDPIYQNLQQVMKAGKHSEEIVRQLLAFARKQSIAPEVLDLNETVEDMLKMLRRLIGEDIDLVWSPGHGLWDVKMDPSQIDQILANLCVNARDAIEGVGKVTIETRNTVVGETILIVEDDVSVLHLTERILDHLGYAVLTSANPAEALTMTREYQGEIHLLMTDVILPEMSGMDLAGEILKIRPTIRTLFMSGYTADIIARQGVLDKGVHFIQKPFTFDSLARKVREAMGSGK